MTVCIAMLAENRKHAVLVSDKLLTVAGALTHQTNHADGKIVSLNENVSAMWCGGAAEAIIILENARRSLGSNKWVSDVANHLNVKHMEYLSDVLVAQHLAPRGFKTVNDFYRAKDVNIDPKIRTDIDSAFASHWLNSQTRFIVCGKESDGVYKVYVLNINPRLPLQLQVNGFGAIGSGENHATYAIVHSDVEYTPAITAAQAKEIALEAKRKAEKDPSVGPETAIIELS